ncbi:pitrilysin family protein [Nonomuraea sp. NPDC005650]|uniref:M16 family metallopeptidase n=1 Tax=Nonomuraea sp. NPDC005650 TaxID=3157045 RepID=UPI0033BBAD4F
MKAHVPDFKEGTLPGGLRTVLVDLPDRGMAAAQLSFRFGTAGDGPELAGLSRVLVQALATPSDRFAVDLERCGGRITATGDHDACSITVSAPAGRFPQVLDLLAEAVIEPRLAPDDVDRLVARRGAQLARERADPPTRAMDAFLAAAHAPGCGYGLPAGGTAGSVAGLRAEAVRALYDRSAGPANACLVVAGDLRRSAMEHALDNSFGGWSRDVEPVRRRAPEPAAPARTVVVDVPRAVQTAIVYGRSVPLLDTAGRIALEVVVHCLGGWFGSRLNLLLRERKGYSYGAHAWLVSRSWQAGHSCQVLVQTSVRTPSTGAAVEEMVAEVDRLSGGDLADGEPASAAESIVQAQPIQAQTPQQVVEWYGRPIRRGYPPDFPRRRLDAVLGLDPAAARETARLLRPAELHLVAAGDAEVIEPMLRGAGLAPEVVA